MAGRKSNCAGSSRDGSTAGKAGKVKMEGRQSKLVTEDKVGEKRVTFKLERDMREEERQGLKEELMTEVSREIKKEIKELETRLCKKIEELNEVTKGGYVRTEELEKREIGWKKKWIEMSDRLKEIEKTLAEKERERQEDRDWEWEVEEGGNTRESRRGVRLSSEEGSGQSRGVSRVGSRHGSTVTVRSEDRLSSIEVEKVRK